MKLMDWIARSAKAVLTGLAVTAVAISTPLSPAAAQGTPIMMKMQSTWPAGNLLHESPVQLAKMIDEMSGGRLKIEFGAAGTTVGAFEVLDAVHKGVLDGGHAWPGYWYGKSTTAGLFGPPPGGPFGMGREEYMGWLYNGGGNELYNELLQKELKMNVVAFFTTTLPYWEAFGWMRKPFANLEEIKKLKFRTSGMGLEMMRIMGVPAVSMAGGDVVPALERGAIDGAEWAIASHDILMGFQNVAKHYYMPDMRQPPSYQEILINKAKWDALPKDLQAIIRYGCMAEMIRMTAHSVALESTAAADLETKYGVKIQQTPPELYKAQLAAVDQIFEAESKKNVFFAKVLESQRAFAKGAVPHSQRMRPPLDKAVEHYWSKK